MDLKIEITYVLQSSQHKSLLGLENRLLALLDNNNVTQQNYKLDLYNVITPVEELRLVLLLDEQGWHPMSALDLIAIADMFDAILFVRDRGLPVTKAVCYRPYGSSNSEEEEVRQYLAKTYGKEDESIFTASSARHPAGHLKPEILKAFYKLQTEVEAPVIDEPTSNPTVYTVDLTDEEIKKRIKDSLGIKNSAYDLTTVTVNPVTSEVTYTVKSTFWGEKEYKVVCNDIHTWPLIKKEEN